MDAARKQPPTRFRSDTESFQHAMSLPIAQVVRELTDLLGATSVAAIGGVSETRAVAQWTRGREPQRAHVLRFALQVAGMIVTYADREVARAWFNGSNPALEDRSPLALLQEAPLNEIQAPILEAARSFAQREAWVNGEPHTPNNGSDGNLFAGT
ncbi:MAG TPA: hypothetical protein VFA29_02375 [Candidatus Baltobacteraceae bacterium]|nr:hypothetical protein [Candidatus Baltobacteraceae bacterium]